MQLEEGIDEWIMPGPQARFDEAALARAIAVFEGELAHLERQVTGQPYVAGEAFTAADVVIGHVLYRWFDIDVPRATRPAVEAYFARLCARPAYREHVMGPYDVLRAEGA